MVLANEEAFDRSSEEKAWSWVSSKIVWHQGGGITGGAWQLVATTLPNSSLSSLITLLISYTDISRRLSPSYYSSTLYYYVAHKVKAPGKKHSKSRAQLSAVTACSHKAARVLSRRHTCYTSVHSSCTGEKRSLQPRPPQTQRTREVSSKRGKPGAKRAFSCREACISVQGMGPACSTRGLREPTQSPPKSNWGQQKAHSAPREELRYVCSTGFHELSLHWPIGRINGILHLQTDFRKWG